MMTRLRSFVLAMLLMGVSSVTHAYTECTGNITRIWTDGTTWVWFDTGLIWAVFPEDDVQTPNSINRSKNIVAFATTAMVSGRSATVRFEDDGVPCTGQQVQKTVWGIYLNAS